MKKRVLIYSILIFCTFFHVNNLYSKVLRIGIMQDKPDIAYKYRPLVAYFKSKGIELHLTGYRSYSDAALKFKNGAVDAMFAGSGVAGTMMIKKLAYPLLRPVNKAGWSTYWAVILAPNGSPKYSNNKKYFKGKRIICSALASSGEFYARSILGPKRELIKTGSHGLAISALSKGMADIAIVKNRVWDEEKDKYPNLEKVGEDKGENPNNTLIISFKVNKSLAKEIKKILLGIEADKSNEAKRVKDTLKIKKYISTDKKDFKHTLKLLKKAGVTKEFSFK